MTLSEIFRPIAATNSSTHFFKLATPSRTAGHKPAVLFQSDTGSRYAVSCLAPAGIQTFHQFPVCPFSHSFPFP